MLSLVAKAQARMDFTGVDTSTYRLYEKGEWKELTRVAREAYRQGIDYFYLRLRTGIAWYNLGNYMQAEINLEKALELNSTDRTAIEYLYYSYLMQKKGSDALGLLEDVIEL